MTCWKNCCNRTPTGRWRAAVLVLTLSVCWTSCEAPGDADPVVARVDDATLTVTALADQIPGTDLAGGEHRAYVEKWLQQEILYQEALDQGVDQKAFVRRLIEQATRDLVVATYLDQTFENATITVTGEDIEAHFHLHSNRYTRDVPEVHAQHILVGSQRDANSLRLALLRGESFEEKARDISLDPETHAEGGDLGYFTADEQPELWEACANLTPGQISRPVSSERGYHIVRLVERKEPGTVRELADVEERVRMELIRERHLQRLEDLITRLKEDHSWQIDETYFE